MRLDEMIGLVWDVEVDDSDIAGVTEAELVEVIELGDAVVDDFIPGRVRVWLNEDDSVWKIEDQQHDGSTFTAM